METEPTGAEAGDAAGIPQLDFSYFPNLIFWLIVALVAIYLILQRVALPRIGAVLAERQGTITNDIAAAEELKMKAREAEKAYERALAEARAEANEIAEKTRADMQAQLDAAIEEADARIAEKSAESERRIAEIRDGAKAAVSEVARDVAGDLVARLGGDPQAADMDAAVAGQMGDRA